MPKVRHITLPSGFVAAGVRCGIKTAKQEDLAIIAAKADAAVALLTTRNQVVGAPVLWCRRILPRGYGKARGVVINSGSSNVCTGKAGLKDAEAMAAETARRLGTTKKKILVASTGVIGQRLPMAKIRKGIAAAAARLGTAHDDAALRGMMTTDKRQKSAVVFSQIGRRRYAVAGIVKGAGMIAPSMATMIAVLTTDLVVAPAALHKALTAAATETFNAITIDSDTSTSDTVILLASGAVGNKPLTAASRHFRSFAEVLREVCGELARAAVSDGEGATKLVEVHVRSARNNKDAQIAAKSVANSPLFKCAVHGADPNWGRIVMALGKSTAKVAGEKLTVRIGGVTVFSRGAGRRFDRKKVTRHLAGDEIEVICELGLGRGRYTALTCDLSGEYITINADYHT